MFILPLDKGISCWFSRLLWPCMYCICCSASKHCATYSHHVIFWILSNIHDFICEFFEKTTLQFVNMSTAMCCLRQNTTCMALNVMLCSKRGINPPTCLKWITCLKCGCKFLSGTNDSIVIVGELVSYFWMKSLYFRPTEQLRPVIWPIWFSLRDMRCPWASTCSLTVSSW